MGSTMTSRSKRKTKTKRRLTANRRELIHDLAVAQGIAYCREYGMGPKWYPTAIANIEESLIKQFRAGKL
jgi:hypothetical protein